MKRNVIEYDGKEYKVKRQRSRGEIVYYSMMGLIYIVLFVPIIVVIVFIFQNKQYIWGALSLASIGLICLFTGTLFRLGKRITLRARETNKSFNKRKKSKINKEMRELEELMEN